MVRACLTFPLLDRPSHPTNTTRSSSPELFDPSSFVIDGAGPHPFDEPRLRPDGATTKRVDQRVKQRVSAPPRHTAPLVRGEDQDDPIVVDGDEEIELLPRDDSPYMPPGPARKPMPGFNAMNSEEVHIPKADIVCRSPPRNVHKLVKVWEERTTQDKVQQLEDRRNAAPRTSNAPLHLDLSKIVQGDKLKNSMKGKVSPYC